MGLQAPAQPGSFVPPPNLREEPFGGSLALGVLLSLAGAAVGALLWLVLANLTEKEFGLVAWVVGILAGTGMSLGYRRRGAAAGFLAASMAVLGIFAGKLLIFWQVVSPILDVGSGGSIATQRETLTASLTMVVLRERGLMDPKRDVDAEIPDRDVDAAAQEAGRRVAALTDAQVRRQADEEFVKAALISERIRERASASMAEETEEQWAAHEAEVTERVKAMSSSELQAARKKFGDRLSAELRPAVLALFFTAMFDAIDVVFALLALCTAFKIASGSASS